MPLFLTVEVVINAKKKKMKIFSPHNYQPGGLGLIGCAGCPRSYHGKCVKMTAEALCPQHVCTGCGKDGLIRYELAPNDMENIDDLLYPCVVCPSAFCRDCLPINQVMPPSQLRTKGNPMKRAKRLPVKMNPRHSQSARARSDTNTQPHPKQGELLMRRSIELEQQGHTLDPSRQYITCSKACTTFYLKFQAGGLEAETRKILPQPTAASIWANARAAKAKEASKKTEDVYCFCKTPGENFFFAACDTCERWYHGECLGIKEADFNSKGLPPFPKK